MMTRNSIYALLLATTTVSAQNTAGLHQLRDHGVLLIIFRAWDHVITLRSQQALLPQSTGTSSRVFFLHQEDSRRYASRLQGMTQKALEDKDYGVTSEPSTFSIFRNADVQRANRQNT